jgi:hypothetical protein
MAPAKSGLGTMCVLRAKLAAKNETTGSTSTAKGHTRIKVRNAGTIEFKTQIGNRNHETFVAGHIHRACRRRGWHRRAALHRAGPTDALQPAARAGVRRDRSALRSAASKPPRTKYTHPQSIRVFVA